MDARLTSVPLASPELGNLVILVCYHQAETGSILPRHFHDCDRKFCPFLLVELKEITVILFADLVSGKNNHILRIIALNKSNILINGICRTPCTSQTPDAFWYGGSTCTPP